LPPCLKKIAYSAEGRGCRKLKTGTLSPDAPNCLYSIELVFDFYTLKPPWRAVCGDLPGKYPKITRKTFFFKRFDHADPEPQKNP